MSWPKRNSNWRPKLVRNWRKVRIRWKMQKLDQQKKMPSPSSTSFLKTSWNWRRLKILTACTFLIDDRETEVKKAERPGKTSVTETDAVKTKTIPKSGLKCWTSLIEESALQNCASSSWNMSPLWISTEITCFSYSYSWWMTLPERNWKIFPWLPASVRTSFLDE